MKRSLIAFVTIVALWALAGCSRTTPAPAEPGTMEPPPEPPPVAAAPTLTGGAWVAEEPWIEDMEGGAVEVGTVHYKLTFTTSRFIHNTFWIESADPRNNVERNDSGTWTADEMTITKVAWQFPVGGEPPSATELVPVRELPIWTDEGRRGSLAARTERLTGQESVGGSSE